MQKESAGLRIYKTGELTVVGFGGADVPDDSCVADYRNELSRLVREHECKVLAFDLTGVVLLPSGLLGLLASVRQMGVDVHLYNPSDDVREALQITCLDQIMEIREVEVD